MGIEDTFFPDGHRRRERQLEKLVCPQPHQSHHSQSDSQSPPWPAMADVVHRPCHGPECTSLEPNAAAEASHLSSMDGINLFRLIWTASFSAAYVFFLAGAILDVARGQARKVKTVICIFSRSSLDALDETINRRPRPLPPLRLGGLADPHGLLADPGPHIQARPNVGLCRRIHVGGAALPCAGYG